MPCLARGPAVLSKPRSMTKPAVPKTTKSAHVPGSGEVSRAAALSTAKPTSTPATGQRKSPRGMERTRYGSTSRAAALTRAGAEDKRRLSQAAAPKPKSQYGAKRRAKLTNVESGYSTIWTTRKYRAMNQKITINAPNEMKPAARVRAGKSCDAAAESTISGGGMSSRSFMWLRLAVRIARRLQDRPERPSTPNDKSSFGKSEVWGHRNRSQRPVFLYNVGSPALIFLRELSVK
jgi:hypothetical protein